MTHHQIKVSIVLLCTLIMLVVTGCGTVMKEAGPDFADTPDREFPTASANAVIP